MTKQEEQPLLHSSSSSEDSNVEINKSFYGPNSLPLYLIVLTLLCFLNFGGYFCYDTPAALHDQIVSDVGLSESSYMELYSWNCWPNVVLCFFAGFLLDRVFGLRFGAILFCAIQFLGQVVFALGATLKHAWLMYAGRFLFGLGSDSLAVAQNTYAVVWFKDKNLNLVFGLQLCMSRIGSTATINVMVPLYDLVKKSFSTDRTLGIALFFSALTIFFSLFCALLLAYLDKKASKYRKDDASKCNEVIKLTGIKDFPLQLWMIFLICLFYYVAVFPFIDLGKIFFEEKFGFTSAESSAVNSIVFILSAPCSPLLGYVVDRFGCNVIAVILGVIFTLGSHGLLSFTYLNPWVGMCLMGVSYSLLACSLWPMVAFIVPLNRLATAYGFMQSVQNLGMAVIAIIAGAILDSDGYFILELFFAACLIVALICSLILCVVDLARGGELNLSKAKRAMLHESLSERDSAEDHCEPSPSSERNSKNEIRNRHHSSFKDDVPDHVFSQETNSDKASLFNRSDSPVST